MKHFSKTLMAAFGLLTVMALAPASASAAGNLQLNLPGLSIGIYDDHGHKKHRKRYRNKRHHNYDYHDSGSRYDRHDRRSDRYYNQRRSNHYYYNDRGGKRYYNTRRNNDNYYSGGRGHNDRGYYNNSRRVEVCPINGYSRGYDRNRNCYKHKGHFHCS